MIIYPSISSALAAIRVTLTTIHKGNTVYVEVNAPLYVNKHYRLNLTWSTDFSDADILEEASLEVAARYGIRPAAGFTIHPV